MMGKFEAGNTIRASQRGATADGEVRFDVGDTFTVLEVEPDTYRGFMDVKVATPGAGRYPDGWVESTRFELATLDPSKVKAGDYIEAEADGTGIKGPVSHINENGYVSIQHLGSFAIDGITTKDTGYRTFTLTAHQPAPEPHIPTLEQIRQAYVDARHDNDIITSQEAEAEIERFLASHAVVDLAKVDIHLLATHNGLVEGSVRRVLADIGIVVP